jgi:D-alanyl-D-alanine carboxypeptidase (penicillin-binding protein 5/6)
MRSLHGGHWRVAAFAGAVLLLVGTASPALAQTIGGDQLAHTHRTVAPLPGAAPLPQVKAETWILADATTGKVLAQKGSHVRRAPASTLKMLTALTVMPHTSPDQVVRASKTAAGTYGSRVGLKPGRAYTLDELWYAVFLPSANDAAIAVAEANGGVALTVREMNEMARRLQADDTFAKTPNGLDTPGQVSSAYDLALIGRAGMKRPDFAKYAGTVRALFPDVKGKASHPIYTTNRLLRHGYHGMTGVKTGFTTQAGRTYVGMATRNGTTLIVSLMGIHESSEWAARKLLDWGFANHDKVASIGTLVDPLPEASSTPSSASAEPAVPAGTPAASASASARSSASNVTARAPSSISTAMLGGAGLVAVAVGSASLLAARLRRRDTSATPSTTDGDAD